MKEVEKPQRDVGKEERGKIWIYLNEKYMFIIFITRQESTINYEISFANILCIMDWVIFYLTE